MTTKHTPTPRVAPVEVSPEQKRTNDLARAALTSNPAAMRITFANRGGTLDSQLAVNDVDAVDILCRMIREAGSLHDGDTIRITFADEG